METATIILISLNIAASLISPLIISLGYFIKHIKKSQCCGSIVELERSPSDSNIDESTALNRTRLILLIKNNINNYYNESWKRRSLKKDSSRS